jgi:hypothetical protein
MSKTNQPTSDKISTPPPRLAPPQASLTRSAPRRENFVFGARKCCCTTIAFSIQPHPHGGAYDTLVIAVDEHNDAEASRLTIKGGAEAKEMLSQLRWIVDKIEKEIGKHDALSINEYVLSTGGA